MSGKSKDPGDTQPRVQSLLFPPLQDDGANYLEWSVDVRSNLCAEELHGVLKKRRAGEPPIPAATRWKALNLIRRHLDHSLKCQYVQIENPTDLWKQLKVRF